MLCQIQHRLRRQLRNAHTLSPSKGFTIVELLVVIVVIAILAAIAIVSYNGIQTRAREASVQTTLKQATTKLLNYAALNSDSLPADLATVGLSDSASTSYQYTVNNAVSPRTYCVSVTEGAVSYFISNTSPAPTVGTCGNPPVVASSIFGANPISGATMHTDGGGSLKLATIFYSYNTAFKVTGGRVYLPSVPAGTSLTIFYVKAFNQSGKVASPNWPDVPSSIPGRYSNIPNSSLKVGWNEVSFPTPATINPYSPGVDGTAVWVGYYFSNGNNYVYALSPSPAAVASTGNSNLFMAENDFEGRNRSANSFGGGTGNLYGIDILAIEP